MSLTAWFLKGRMAAYDKHLEECREHSIAMARMDERLVSVESQIQSIHATVRWVGDCMLTIGSQLKIKLPDRP